MEGAFFYIHFPFIFFSFLQSNTQTLLIFLFLFSFNDFLNYELVDNSKKLRAGSSRKLVVEPGFVRRAETIDR